MLDLSNIVLVAFGSTKVPETIKAINHCQKLANFHSTIYLTDHKIDNYNNIIHVPIRNIPSIKDYQKFIVKESPNIILSSIPDSFNGHFLCINWDGFIVNPESWTNEFLKYDYIGAPWPWFNHMVGNGGFCLKSIKFLKTQQNICKNYLVKHNEDVELCITLRKQFEYNNCKYASSTIGYNFSTEVGDIEKNKSFGFHDFKYHPNYKQYIL
jgi:hypothetical protein